MVFRGEVYWAKLEAPVGRHPVLVIQNNKGNQFSPSTIVAYISTKPPDKPYPFLVELDNRLLGEPCWVHCETLLTLPQDLLVEKCGTLGRREMDEVDEALHLSLNLD